MLILQENQRAYCPRQLFQGTNVILLFVILLFFGVFENAERRLEILYIL